MRGRGTFAVVAVAVLAALLLVSGAAAAQGHDLREVPAHAVAMARAVLHPGPPPGPPGVGEHLHHHAAGHHAGPPSAGPSPGIGVPDASASAASVAGTAAGALLLRLLAPLYTRRSAAELLEHPLRARLHACVRAAPGGSVAELATMAGTGRTTADYHLRLLERAGALWSRREGRVRRCYPRGHAAEAPGARGALAHPKGRALAALVAAAPGVGLTEAARACALSPSLATWHLARLVKAGVLRRERSGLRVRYFATDR